MTMRLKATAQIVRNYQELFVNRRAYTVQSLRPHPETGRHYYFRPSQKSIGCHREFSLLGLIVRPFAISCE